MELKDRIVVVTGAARGIGAALARSFARHGAAHVICADLDLDAAGQVARDIDGTATRVDVAQEQDISNLIRDVESEIGPIDLFCSNAGILTLGGLDVPNELWQKTWEINVMAHVYAARHVVPRMIERGGGYILNTASAAGLLNQIGAAPYGVTKHAAVGFSEWLSMTYGDDGIRVSALCPQAVRSDMTKGFETSVAAIDGLLEPDVVAETCVQAIREERFLILPHPQVNDYIQIKAADYDRWLGGMRRLNRVYGTPESSPSE